VAGGQKPSCDSSPDCPFEVRRTPGEREETGGLGAPCGFWVEKGAPGTALATVVATDLPDIKWLATDGAWGVVLIHEGQKHYAYTAVPLTAGETGDRAFCGDDAGRICVTTGRTEPVVRNGRCGMPCQDAGEAH
jgi:hypothetical protein